MRGLDRVVPQAQTVERARSKIFDQHVSPVEDSAQRRAAARLLEVERDAFLVAVDAEEVGALAGDKGRSPGPRLVPAPGLLDLDDARPHVGQQHRAIRS